MIYSLCTAHSTTHLHKPPMYIDTHTFTMTILLLLSKPPLVPPPRHVLLAVVGTNAGCPLRNAALPPPHEHKQTWGQLARRIRSLCHVVYSWARELEVALENNNWERERERERERESVSPGYNIFLCSWSQVLLCSSVKKKEQIWCITCAEFTWGPK